MTTITIRTDGIVEHVGALPIELPLTNVKRRRVSHIVPLNPLLRLAFRGLRLAFGEQGRAAAWTRRWPGAWRATIIATGQTYINTSRAECIEWELDTLSGPLFDL